MNELYYHTSYGTIYGNQHFVFFGDITKHEVTVEIIMFICKIITIVFRQNILKIAHFTMGYKWDIDGAMDFLQIIENQYDAILMSHLVFSKNGTLRTHSFV
jgi:hypothetical protein